MSRLGSTILSGLQGGSENAMALERLRMAAEEMRRREEQQNLALFQERAARTYYGQRYAQLRPPTAETAGPWSQSNDVFMNLPSGMMGEEIDRIEKEQKQQIRKQNLDKRVYPFLESLAKLGHQKEASRRRAMYESMDPSALEGTSLKWAYEELFSDPGQEDMTPDEYEALATGAYPDDPGSTEMGPFAMGHEPAAPTPGIGHDLANIYRVTGVKPSPAVVASMMRMQQQKSGGADGPRMPMTPEMVMALRKDITDPSQAQATADAWNQGALGDQFKTYMNRAKPQTPDKGAQADAEDAVIESKTNLDEAEERVREIEQEQLPISMKGKAADTWLSEKQTRLTNAKKLRDQARRNHAEAEKRKQRAAKGLFTKEEDAAGGAGPAGGAAGGIDDKSIDEFIDLLMQDKKRGK